MSNIQKYHLNETVYTKLNQRRFMLVDAVERIRGVRTIFLAADMYPDIFNNPTFDSLVANEMIGAKEQLGAVNACLLFENTRYNTYDDVTTGALMVNELNMLIISRFYCEDSNSKCIIVVPVVNSEVAFYEERGFKPLCDWLLGGKFYYTTKEEFKAAGSISTLFRHVENYDIRINDVSDAIPIEYKMKEEFNFKENIADTKRKMYLETINMNYKNSEFDGDEMGSMTLNPKPLLTLGMDYEDMEYAFEKQASLNSVKEQRHLVFYPGYCFFCLEPFCAKDKVHDKNTGLVRKMSARALRDVHARQLVIGRYYDEYEDIKRRK